MHVHRAAELAIGPVVPGFSFARWPGKSALSLRRVSAQRVLVTAGEVPDAFFGVASGEVRLLFRDARGVESTLEAVGPGVLFGWSAFVASRPSTFEARSTRRSELLVIDRVAYGRLLGEVPGFAASMLSLLAVRHHDLLVALESSRLHSAEERVMASLRRMMGSPRAASERGGILVAVSQEELAQTSSISRQSANGILRRWVGVGWARCQYGRVWLSPAHPLLKGAAPR